MPPKLGFAVFNARTKNATFSKQAFVKLFVEVFLKSNKIGAELGWRKGWVPDKGRIQMAMELSKNNSEMYVNSKFNNASLIQYTGSLFTKKIRWNR